jgi:glycosyl transferase family 25
VELPPTYVVNLERSVDRREQITRDLQNLGIPFEIFAAVDGETLTGKELDVYSEQRARKEGGRALSRGEIGCALSHLRLYQKLLESDEEEFLILEDDAEVGWALVELLRNRERFEVGWEHINFCTDARTKPFGDRVWDIYRLAKFSRMANGTVAYLLNRKGAEKLLRRAFPIAYAADDLTGSTQVTGLASYGVFPPVATYARGAGTISRPLNPSVYRAKKAVKRKLRKLIDKI